MHLRNPVWNYYELVPKTRPTQAEPWFLTLCRSSYIPSKKTTGTIIIPPPRLSSPSSPSSQNITNIIWETQKKQTSSTNQHKSESWTHLSPLKTSSAAAPFDRTNLHFPGTPWRQSFDAKSRWEAVRHTSPAGLQLAFRKNKVNPYMGPKDSYRFVVAQVPCTSW